MLLFFMLLKSAILCDLYLLTYIICAIETREFPGRNVVFNKTIAGRRRTLLLKVSNVQMFKLKVSNVHVGF